MPTPSRAQGTKKATGARAAAHAQVRADLLRSAREQLHAVGPAQLSMRAVVADVGMVSSAIYRYFPSRDHLLTALIVESYEQLGQSLAARLEAAAHELPREQFVAVAGEFVAWSLAHPQDFALLYGSPVPDYRAPEDTVAPAAQVAAPFFAAMGRAAGGPPQGGRGLRRRLPDDLASQAREVGAALGLGLPDAVVVGAFLAMGHLVGVVTLHLGGHLVGTFEPADGLLAAACEASADLAGL